MPKEQMTTIDSKINTLFFALPNEFLRKEAVELSSRLGIKSRSTDTYLSELVKNQKLRHDDHGKYFKN